MIDEKTTSKLKQIAKCLGPNWKVDFIKSERDFIIIRNGYNIELRLRKKYGTKYAYNVGVYLMKKPDIFYSHQALGYDKIVMSHSVKTIVNTLKTKVIPDDIDQQVIKMKNSLSKWEDVLKLEEYFIQSLRAFGKVSKPLYGHDRYSIDLTPNHEEDEKTNINISRHKKEIYNISTELSRDNIIKVIGFIKGLLENESC